MTDLKAVNASRSSAGAELRKSLLKLSERYDAEAAAGLDVCYQFSIVDAGNYYLIVKDKRCQLFDGQCDDPTVTLVMDLATLEDVLSGAVQGLQALLFSRIVVTGEMSLAARLTKMFALQ